MKNALIGLASAGALAATALTVGGQSGSAHVAVAGAEPLVKVQGAVTDGAHRAVADQRLEMWALVPRTDAEMRAYAPQDMVLLDSAISDASGRYALDVPRSASASKVASSSGQLSLRVFSTGASGRYVYKAFQVDTTDDADGAPKSLDVAAKGPEPQTVQLDLTATAAGTVASKGPDRCGDRMNGCWGPFNACRRHEAPRWVDHRTWDSEHWVKLAHARTFRKFTRSYSIDNGNYVETSVLAHIGGSQLPELFKAGFSTTERNGWGMGQRVDRRQNVWVLVRMEQRYHELYCVDTSYPDGPHLRGTAIAEYYPYRPTGDIALRKTRLPFHMACRHRSRGLRGGYNQTQSRGTTRTTSRSFNISGAFGLAKFGLTWSRVYGHEGSNTMMMRLAGSNRVRGRLCGDTDKPLYARNVREVLPRDL